MTASASPMTEQVISPRPRKLHTAAPVEPSERRLSTIRGLLRTLNEAKETRFGAESCSGDIDDAVPLMPEVWKNYEPIYLALKRMHSLGRQQAVEGIPLGTLWWHLSQRYLMAEQKFIWRVGGRDVEAIIRRPRCICGFRLYNPEQARGHVEKAHKPQAVRVTLYTKEYRLVLNPQTGSPERCQRCERLGVRWISDELYRVGVEPFLPVVFLEARRES